MQGKNLQKQISTFNQGADFDASGESARGKEGFYKDGYNIANREDNGQQNNIQKIGGQANLYDGTDPNFNNANPNYTCIGTTFLNNSTVNIWCSSVNTDPVIFEVNGLVMVSTTKLGFTLPHVLQIAKDESCIGGEFCVCDQDDNCPPYIFDLADIITNYHNNTGKYFDPNFNPNLYTGSLNTAQDHPVFVELVNNPTGGGLASGMYSYSICFADSLGNTTNYSVATPLIPVIAAQGTNSGQYPNSKTYGLATGQISTFGIHLRIRITNLSGFTSIQVRRERYYTSQQLDALPDEIAYRTWVTDIKGGTINITANNGIGVLDILDSGNITDWSPLTDEGDTIQNTGQFFPKSPRYFNRRLAYLNINFPSQNLTDTIPASDIFIADSDGLATTVVEKLGTAGQRDAYNQTYFKPLATGEKYGWGLMGIGSTGVSTFVLPIKTGSGAGQDFTDFQYPNRREALTTTPNGGKKYSYDKWRGAPFAANINSNAGSNNSYVHEIFDLADAIQKTDSTTIRAIDTTSGYNPFTPVSDTDTDVTGHNQIINDSVFTDPALLDYSNNYNPKGFAPNYYANGMAFYGVKTLPSWVKALSIVRTKRAGRVVAQGIGFYKLWEANNPDIVNPILPGYTCKDPQIIRFYSPDTDINNGIVNIQEIIDNLSDYQIQLVSPLGLFSEVYNYQFTGGYANPPHYCTHLDMLSYARILYEDGTINPTDIPVDGNYPVGNNDGYVSFGKWRNTDQPSLPTNYIFGITSITQFAPNTANVDATNSRNNFLEIKLSSSLYQHLFNSTVEIPSEWSVRPLHEPVYIVNIIKTADVPVENNVQNYVETGHLQKLSSIIGITTGSSQTLPLIDERWEDCIPNPFSNGAVETTSTDDRYIYVNGQAWLNCTYLSQADFITIITAISNNGYYIGSINNNYQKVYGVYQNDNVGFEGYTDINGIVHANQLQFNIIFQYNFPNQGVLLTNEDSSFCIPQQTGGITYITVNYDNRIPIKVFAGDVTIGECLFSNFDRQSKSSETQLGQTEFQIGYSQNPDDEDNYSSFPLPYAGYEIPSNIKVLQKTATPDGISDLIFANDPAVGHPIAAVDFIRQLLIMFACESRVNAALNFSTNLLSDYPANGCLDSFPGINYIMRPSAYSLVNLYVNLPETSYQASYGTNEAYKWSYGGFRFATNLNLDYAKQLIDNDNFSMPVFGFTEQLKNCSLLIWSQQRAVNQQNDPNLKTILSTSLYYLDDAMGAGKYLYDNNTAKGNNLIAVMELGICLAVTEKRTISDVTGNVLTYLEEADNNFVTDQVWLSKTIGCPDEMWRGIAEYNNKLFFPNRESIYCLEEMTLKDILKDPRHVKGSYYGRILPILQSIQSVYTTPMCAVYDAQHKEYWIFISNNISPFNNNGSTFSFADDDKKKFWNGEFEYNFDKFLYVNYFNFPPINNTFLSVLAMKGLQTFQLNKGDVANGCQVHFVVNEEAFQGKQIQDMTIGSNVKPTQLYVDLNYLTPVTFQNFFKNYTNGFYTQIPRKTAAPNNRVQSKYFFIRLFYTGSGNFFLSNILTGLKAILQ